MSETGLKMLIFALSALLLLPFGLTWLLFCSARYESEKALVKKRLLPATALNLLGNGAALYGVSALVFHTRKPWTRVLDLLRLRSSWSDLEALSLVVVIVCGVGIAGGFMLRFLFLRKQKAPVSRSRWGIMLALSLVCVSLLLAVFTLSGESVKHLYLSEIARKTTVFQIDPEGTRKLGSNGQEISCVLVSNPDPLELRGVTLCLSDTEDDPGPLSFPDLTIPAGGDIYLVQPADQGSDLKKNGETTIYLCRADGKVIDQVQTPALEDFAFYRLISGTTDQWQVVRPGPQVASPSFSAESGFYPEAFELSISAPEGLVISYSLDGSDPSVGGLSYHGSIHIEDPTPQENVYSTRTDVSANFLTGSPMYTVPDRPVDKCAVVRAVCTDAEGNTSDVVTASYFIGFDTREGYENLGIISLTSDPDHLFSDEAGIYVLGDTYLKNPPEDVAALGWWRCPANYHQRERLWERPASVQFFDRDRTLLLSKEVGVRVKGGVSSAHVPKGLNLYARSLYDGDSRFSADLFGNGYLAKRISLNAGGNDEKLKVRDWLTARLIEGLNLTTTTFTPFALFLDGEYWGNYWLTEQFDELFFSNTFALQSANIVSYKNGTMKFGQESDAQLYKEMIRFLSKEDMNEAKNWREAQELADMNNFMTYYALEMYLGNQDWGLNKNTFLWRTRQWENAAEGDTRWRQALFDVNHPSCYRDGTGDTLSYMLNRDAVFRNLMTNTEFCNGFYAALQKLATEVFTPERVEVALNEYTALMEKPMALEHQRFSRGSTLSGLNTIRSFISERQGYILQLCDDWFSAHPVPEKE